jgi:hypothetical protein
VLYDAAMRATPLLPLLLLALALVGCPTEEPEPATLGMILVEDGVTYAGVASIDITPVIAETFTDVNGNHDFDGCLDDPTAADEDCDEPFDDVDGDGWFDATFIGGYGPMRPANDVHDPVFARALVLAHDGAYLAIVSCDLVGLGSPRVDAAREALVADGFEGDRYLAVATHNHQGPDTMGLWGNPMNLADPVSGIDPVYQARVEAALEQAVRDAAVAMEPVSLTVGAQRMRDRTPWFNGTLFGGKNPDAKMVGMVHDGRDPVIASDQLLVVQGTAEGGVLFTLTSWSGHPEVRGSNSNSISSDWPGVARPLIEEHFGGLAIHVPESLGGMQSALGGDLPLVLPDGTHVMQVCDAEAIVDEADADCFGQDEGAIRVDADGDEVPEWAERDSWDFVTSHGWHIAEATIDVVADSEPMEAWPLRAARAPVYVPIENLAYQLLGPSGIFDLDFDDAIYDPTLCPWSLGSDLGCIETSTARLQIGPIGIVAVPGELLPELAWGFPEDPQFELERADPTARGGEGLYFRQHDHDCDELDWTYCTEDLAIGDCDCLSTHAWPYDLAPTARAPMLESFDTPYVAAMSMANDYLSYIVPEPDFNRQVSLLSDDDGDHYEDTVSPSSSFATSILEAQERLAADW